MTAKEYLQQIKRIDTVIEQKKQELNDLCLMSRSMGSADYSKERVQTSPSGDAPYVNAVNRKVDIEAKIKVEIDVLISKRSEIINQIQGLKNADHISLLYKRYVEHKKLEVIADEMNYTYQHVRRLHGRALLAFERCYTKLHFNVL